MFDCTVTLGSERVYYPFLESQEGRGGQDGFIYPAGSFSSSSSAICVTEGDGEYIQSLIAKSMQAAESAMAIAWSPFAESLEENHAIQSFYPQDMSAAKTFAVLSEKVSKRKKNESSGPSLKRKKVNQSSASKMSRSQLSDIDYLAAKVQEYWSNHHLTLEEKKELVVLMVSEKGLSVTSQIGLKNRLQTMLKNSFPGKRNPMIEELFREIRVKSNHSGIDFQMQQKRMDRIHELLIKASGRQ